MVTPVLVPTTGLPAATTPLAGTEITSVVQGGVTKQVAVSNLSSFRTRILATADVPFYVSDSGNDSTNTGLSALSPFRTKEHAWDVARDDYDWGGEWRPIINMAATGSGFTTDRIIADGALTGAAPGYSGIFRGAGASTHRIRVASSCVSASNGASILLEGMKLESPGAAYCTIQSYLFARTYIGDGMDLGTAGFGHIQAALGYIRFHDDFTISAQAPIALLSESAGVFDTGTATVTVSGTQAYSTAFLHCGDAASVFLHDVVWNVTGTVTGVRALITTRGNVTPTIAKINALPGDVEYTWTGADYTSLVSNYVAAGAQSVTYPGTNGKFAVVGPSGEVVATPSSTVNAVISNAGNSGLAIHSAAANNGYLIFGTTGAGGDFQGGIYYTHATNLLNFQVSQNLRATLDASGILDVSGYYEVDGTQVVTNRVTGFVAMAGAAVKDASTINSSTITATDGNIQALAKYVKALGDALTTHGLIGT